MKTIAFDTTRDMYAWIDGTEISGPCCVVDSWTWGLCLINPAKNMSMCLTPEQTEVF